MNRGLGLVYYAAGDFEKAQYYCLKAQKYNPDSLTVPFFLFLIYYSREMYEESIEQFIRFLHLGKKDELAIAMKETYEKSGYHNAIRYYTDRTEYRNLPLFYVILGKNKEAIDAINRILDSNTYAWFTSYLKTLPFFEPLRNEPGYEPLLKRMNLN